MASRGQNTALQGKFLPNGAKGRYNSSPIGSWIVNGVVFLAVNLDGIIRFLASVVWIHVDVNNDLACSITAGAFDTAVLCVSWKAWLIGQIP
jgi:hypothetical protein